VQLVRNTLTAHVKALQQRACSTKLSLHCCSTHAAQSSACSSIAKPAHPNACVAHMQLHRAAWCSCELVQASLTLCMSLCRPGEPDAVHELVQASLTLCMPNFRLMIWKQHSVHIGL
jgi:hypothetical protein